MNFTLEELIRKSTVPVDIPPKPSLIPALAAIKEQGSLDNNTPLKTSEYNVSPPPKGIPLAVPEKNIPVNNIATQLEAIAKSGVADEAIAEMAADSRNGRHELNQQIHAQQAAAKRQEEFTNLMMMFLQQQVQNNKVAENSVGKEVKEVLSEVKEAIKESGAKKTRKKKEPIEEEVDELLKEIQESGDVFSIDKINYYDKPTLQKYLKEFGLPTSGTKDSLKERLSARFDRDTQDRLTGLNYSTATASRPNDEVEITFDDDDEPDLESGLHTSRVEEKYATGQGIKKKAGRRKEALPVVLPGGLDKKKTNYIKFGSCYLNLNKLNFENTVSLCEKYTPTIKKLYGLPNKKCSSDLKAVIVHILKEGSLGDISDINVDEKDYLMKILGRTRPDIRMSEKTKLKLEALKHVDKKKKKDKIPFETKDALLDRLAVLYGSVKAGNNNNSGISREISSILNQLVVTGEMTSRDARDLSIKMLGKI